MKSTPFGFGFSFPTDAAHQARQRHGGSDTGTAHLGDDPGALFTGTVAATTVRQTSTRGAS